MNAKRIRLSVALVALAGPIHAASAQWRGGIGVIGDSYSDEYQFYAPDRSTARNWVEILAATRKLDFGSFSITPRAEPRNQGYAYNWARSDATTETMIATGQHTGLAAQVASGDVTLAVMFIGGNDFINAMNAPDPLASLQQAGPRAEANFELAFQTILAAHPDVKLVAATVPDIRHLPEFRAALRADQLSSAALEAATAAMAHYNGRIRALACRHPRVSLLDLDLVTRLRDRLNPESVSVAGHPIERRVPGNDPTHLFLADLRHLGTVGQGLLAQLIVTAIDAKFQAEVGPLSQREILEIASIGRVEPVHVAGGTISNGSLSPTAAVAAATRDGHVDRAVLTTPSAELP
jgi:phospholipase/lecithinase/hemolysin